MPRKKAVLILDPLRMQDQIGYLSERVEILLRSGDQFWVSMTEDQAPRLVEQGISVIFHDEADTVELPAIVFDPLAAAPEPPAGLEAALPSGAAQTYFLVQFVAPAPPEWVQEVIASGGAYIRNIPFNAAIFRFTGDEAAAAGRLPQVRWVGIYHPAYALNYTLTSVDYPFSAISLRELAVDPSRVPTSEDGNIEVQVFEDADLESVRSGLEAAGASVAFETGMGFVVRVPGGRVADLARIRGVFSVEPYYVAEPENDRGRIIISAEEVGNSGNNGFLVNLDGSGEIVGVVDSGLDHGDPARLGDIHPDIRGRVLSITNIAPGGGPTVPDTGGAHGTHVTGSIAGNGAASNGRIKGVAPSCHIVFQGPTQTGAAAVIAFYRAHRAGARVHHNSWGRTSGITGNNLYGAEAQRIDTFCYLYPDSLVVFSAGNDEQDVQGAPDGVLDANQLKPEKPSKNILVVGAIENLRDNDGYKDSYRSFDSASYTHAAFDALAGGPSGDYTMSDNPDQMALFSSRGRINRNTPGPPPGIAWTGRVRPDITAPGTNIISMRSSVGDSFSDWRAPGTVDKDKYAIKHGTSMAAPHVSGAAILVRQYYRSRFGQLRRPQLLEGIAVGASGPFPDFVGIPACCPHQDGSIFAWITPAKEADEKRIAAARLSRSLTWVDTNVKVLATNVGNRPQPVLGRHGEHTLLVHRAADGSIKLDRFSRDLTHDGAFGSGGTATVASGSREDEFTGPALLVAGNEVGVCWPGSTENAILFRRFNAETGAAIGAAAVTLGSGTNTSPHPYITHNGNHWAIVWADHGGGDFRILMRRVSAAGTPVGTEAQAISEGTREMRDPHLTWDPSSNRFALVWCGRSSSGSGEEITVRFLNAEGAPSGNEIRLLGLPSDQRMRRPCITVRPGGGYVLMWEDSAQNNQYDVYLTFLGAEGQLDDRRIPQDSLDPSRRRVLRISDTPQDTKGFCALADSSAISVAWQSLDEINSDRLDVSVLNVTPEGAFQAQADPRTPLIQSGKYKAHSLADHAITSLDSVSMAWAGGEYYLARWESPEPLGLTSRLALVRTNADGLPDSTYGVNGGRTLSDNIFHRRCEMLWAAERNLLACIVAGAFGRQSIYLFDGAGDPLDGSRVGTVAFGPGGARHIDEMGSNTVGPQLGYLNLAAPNFGIIAVFGAGFPFTNVIRHTIFNRQGNSIDGDGNAKAPRVSDLVRAAGPNGILGAARHGWFHYVNDERHSVAVWHQAAGPREADRKDVFINRFDRHGTAVGAPIPLLPRPAGDNSDSLNAVVTPRPMGINAANSLQWEYGVVWQYRAAPADPWEIRFSRLQRNGQVMPNPGAPAPAANNVRVIFPGLAGADGNPIWPAGAHAMEPQLVCTFTDEPWRPAPAPATPIGTIWNQWSPGYGLAFIGQPVAGGNRSLYFTVLDENGNRIQLPQAPPNPATVASILQVTGREADVREFKLIWNGRTFRLTWTEVEAGRIRHMETGLTRHGSLDVYQGPSGALLRATLINGATNINNTSLPNMPVAPITDVNRNQGYGWGRANLRQSLAPSSPVTYYVRDDGSVGPGRTARYRFSLPPRTVLLRATLTWNDPPGPLVVNNMHLRITVSASGQIYHGNTWQPAPNEWQSQHVAAGAVFDANQTVEQIVIGNPPAGDYDVEVIAQPFPTNPHMRFNAQPFALVFTGSGREVRFGHPPWDISFY